MTFSSHDNKIATIYTTQWAEVKKNMMENFSFHGELCNFCSSFAVLLLSMIVGGVQCNEWEIFNKAWKLTESLSQIYAMGCERRKKNKKK